MLPLQSVCVSVAQSVCLLQLSQSKASAHIVQDEAAASHRALGARLWLSTAGAGDQGAHDEQTQLELDQVLLLELDHVLLLLPRL